MVVSSVTRFFQVCVLFFEDCLSVSVFMLIFHGFYLVSLLIRDPSFCFSISSACSISPTFPLHSSYLLISPAFSLSSFRSILLLLSSTTLLSTPPSTDSNSAPSNFTIFSTTSSTTNWSDFTRLNKTLYLFINLGALVLAHRLRTPRRTISHRDPVLVRACPWSPWFLSATTSQRDLPVAVIVPCALCLQTSLKFDFYVWLPIQIHLNLTFSGKYKQSLELARLINGYITNMLKA